MTQRRKVPDALSIDGSGDPDEEFECYEGYGGYFDGTVFEAPATMEALVLSVARSQPGGDPPFLSDRYIYRLDSETGRAVFTHADTVEHEVEVRADGTS